MSIEDRPEHLIHSTLDADGVLLATIDMPGRTMNVFSAGLMDALDALMDRAERDAAVKSVVVTSGKLSFLAGADLVMVRGYTEQARTATHDQMFATCGRLGRQFVRMEESAKPWVAAVNGIALGGGLELALACRQRLVADDPRLQLGVPEVRWGLLPGAGGTQRLPRLAPFGAAMDLLLTGRSIDPATALEFGIVNGVLPAARLVDAAKALARSLQGQPYRVRDKFARLEQADVPAWSEATARSLAASHGVDAERYALYPAYSAICDSVLKGARQTLADATATEMQQFLRLMFSPVAGCMIRTLFLERLRAERELAAPEGLRVERLAHGPISAARAAWSVALDKLKLTRDADAALGADALELTCADGSRHRFALRVLDEPAGDAAVPQLVLAPAGPYGRVLEIVGADSPARAATPVPAPAPTTTATTETRAGAAAAAAALAARTRCLPWPTPGPSSVLQRLRGLPLEAQAVQAAAIAATPGFGEAAFLDVAACLAGIAPAWSGGPLAWAADLGRPQRA